MGLDSHERHDHFEYRLVLARGCCSHHQPSNAAMPVSGVETLPAQAAIAAASNAMPDPRIASGFSIGELRGRTIMLDFQDRLAIDSDATAGTAARGMVESREKCPEPGPVASTRAEIDMDPLIPEYMKRVYYWAYLNPRNVRLLDRETVVKTILWFQHHKLQQAAFDEIQPGENVLQPASVYGDFCPNLARHIGPAGKLEIIDVAPVQVLACRAKMAHLPQVRVQRGNAVQLGNHLYDAVCCYFLLHEVPLEYKYAIVQELLDRVRPGGKVIFVDYHKPHWAHPLKLITSIVFDTLEPFAKDLWHLAIEEFADGDPCFVWRRQNYFAGLFQKVVARRVR